MSKADENDLHHTLRDVPADEDRDEEIYFAYSATLRIFGDIPDIGEITQQLGVAPTHVYRKNESRSPQSPLYKHDMWSYSVPVSRSEPLHVHIDALWNTFKGHKQYLLQLKNGLTVDVFLGYRSNCDTAGVEVRHQSLEMFIELQVPFGLSLIVV